MSSIPIVDIDDKLRLIGTAHISRESAEVVKQQISEWKPDIVAIELDSNRLAHLQNPEKFDDEALSKVLKEGRTLVLGQTGEPGQHPYVQSHNMDEGSVWDTGEGSGV